MRNICYIKDTFDINAHQPVKKIVESLIEILSQHTLVWYLFTKINVKLIILQSTAYFVIQCTSYILVNI